MLILIISNILLEDVNAMIVTVANVNATSFTKRWTIIMGLFTKTL